MYNEELKVFQRPNTKSEIIAISFYSSLNEHKSTIVSHTAHYFLLINKFKLSALDKQVFNQ